MNYHDKIYVAGHGGLVGSALMRLLRKQGYHHLVTRSSVQLDLRDQRAVYEFFDQERPQYVFLAAAKVGGIEANYAYPADFIYDNTMIQTNIISACARYDSKKLLFLGSSCIYPRLCPQPIKEEYLLTGPLEPTNEPYAIAKIAGLKMCQAYRRQFGNNFIMAMPTNIFGPGDRFDVHKSHVIPALITKFHTAKIEHRDHVVVWGSGIPRREFLFVDDLASALVALMERYDDDEFINIGVGEDVTIAELAHLIKSIVGFRGEIIFDTTKPDGTPQKLLDVHKIKALGWQATTSLHHGLEQTYDWFLKHAASKN